VHPNTDNDAHKRATLLIDKDDPKLVNSKTDIEAAKRNMPNTAMVEPSLATDRNDQEEPSLK
jgi:hypothetical protein